MYACNATQHPELFGLKSAIQQVEELERQLNESIARKANARTRLSLNPRKCDKRSQLELQLEFLWEHAIRWRTYCNAYSAVNFFAEQLSNSRLLLDESIHRVMEWTESGGFRRQTENSTQPFVYFEDVWMTLERADLLSISTRTALGRAEYPGMPILELRFATTKINHHPFTLADLEPLAKNNLNRNYTLRVNCLDEPVDRPYDFLNRIKGWSEPADYPLMMWGSSKPCGPFLTLEEAQNALIVVKDKIGNRVRDYEPVVVDLSTDSVVQDNR